MKTSTLLVTTVIASLFLLGACKNNNTQVPVAATDTTGFAQFQQWKNSLATEQTNQVIAHKHSTARKSTSGTMNSSTTNEAKVVKKKGWSKAAKYAVIGTAAGAVTGAIINKRNPVKGAVIGMFLAVLRIKKKAVIKQSKKYKEEESRFHTGGLKIRRYFIRNTTGYNF